LAASNQQTFCLRLTPLFSVATRVLHPACVSAFRDEDKRAFVCIRRRQFFLKRFAAPRWVFIFMVFPIFFF